MKKKHNSPWLKSLAAHVIAERKRRGISLRSHAKLLKISPATLSRIEHEQPCDLLTLARISKGTGIAVDVLLGVRS